MATRPPRVLVTRSPHQSSELANHLRSLGVEPILIPAIEITEPTSFRALDAALAQLHDFHWLLFTSANAVEAFHRRLTANPNALILTEAQSHPTSAVILSEARSQDRAQPKDPPVGSRPASPPEPSAPGPRTFKIAAIGPSTARALEAIGLAPDLLPPQAVAESLTSALLPHVRQPDGSRTHFLLIRAEEAREVLPETLRSTGAFVTIAPAYRTVIPTESIPAIRDLFGAPENYPDAITFTSASTVSNLLALCEAAAVTLPPEPLRISIGPITSQALRDVHLPPHAEALTASTQALAEAVLEARKGADA
jgi:uroporphyrinogen-III synthase